jgi:hypothetical protein
MSSSNVPETSTCHDDNRELGRRLVAALLSYHYGLASVDYTLRRYVPKDVNPSWDALAHDLLNAMILQVQGAIMKHLRK